MCVHLMNAFRGQKRALNYPLTGVTDGYEPLGGCWASTWVFFKCSQCL